MAMGDVRWHVVARAGDLPQQVTSQLGLRTRWIVLLTRITAAIAEATDAARLDLTLGRPVLVVDSTDVDADGKPLVTKRSRFAAERVEFVVES